MPPIEASHWSQAKQTTLKPTIVYSARQHANEVSSTSHVLRMAELLLTDPVYRDKLHTVTVVIHPITNAAGAPHASALQPLNPTPLHPAPPPVPLVLPVPSPPLHPAPPSPDTAPPPTPLPPCLPCVCAGPRRR